MCVQSSRHKKEFFLLVQGHAPIAGILEFGLIALNPFVNWSTLLPMLIGFRVCGNSISSSAIEIFFPVDTMQTRENRSQNRSGLW